MTDYTIFDGIQLKRDGIDPEQWPKLSCSQANQTTLEASDLKLDTNREILFQDNGQIRAVGDIRFLTGATTPTERLSLLANGDVAIGTTTTPTHLKVNGTVQATAFQGDGSALAGKVSTAGDTMTGALTIQNTLTVSGTVKAGAFQGDGSNLDGVVHTAGGTVDGSLSIKNALTVQGKTSVLTNSGNPALQLFATGEASGYLTLLDKNGRQAIQMDAGTGTGSIQLKNSADKGVCLVQTSEEAGYISLNNKSGERAVVQLYASQEGESGVVKVLDSVGNLSVQLNENGISTRALAIRDSSGNSTASIDSDGSINTSGYLFASRGISTSGYLFASGGINTSNSLYADIISARAFGTVNTGFINVNKSNGNPAIRLFETAASTGYIGIYGTDGNPKVWLNAANTGYVDAGTLNARKNDGNFAVQIFALDGNRGYIGIHGTDGNQKVWLNGADTGYINAGTLNARKNDGNLAVQIFALDGNKGFISVRGTDGNQKIWLNGQDSGYVGAGVLSAVKTNGNLAAQLYGAESGNLAIFNSDGKVVTLVGTNSANAGFLETKTKAEKIAVRISTINDGSGSIGVHDSNGNLKLYLHGNGAKSFVMPHPHDESQNIIYAAIEGPEAAAYIRGKAKLTAGRAEVDFPEHFSLVVNPDTITIQLTPRSAESKGLAVVAQSERGFSVRELWQGEGEYEFDYFVAGVRQGFENFTPVVSKGLTAFGESMDGDLSIRSESLHPSAIAQEVMESPTAGSGSMESPAAQAVEPLNRQASQPTGASELPPSFATGFEAIRPEFASAVPQLFSINPVPSPPAINFEDK